MVLNAFSINSLSRERRKKKSIYRGEDLYRFYRLMAEKVSRCRPSHNKVVRVFWRWGFVLCPLCGREVGLGCPWSITVCSVSCSSTTITAPIVSCLQPMTEPAFLKSVSVTGFNAAAPADRRGDESAGLNTSSISAFSGIEFAVCCSYSCVQPCCWPANSVFCHHQGACTPCITCISSTQDDQKPQRHYSTCLPFGPRWAAIVYSPPCPLPVL